MKYQEMRALRRADAEGTLADPRPRMRALARQFPGSLREIDRLPLEDIEGRIAALERACLDPSSVEPWMPVMARFHEEMREALAIKRTVGKRHVTGELRERTLRAHAAARRWDLDRLASPPTRRLSDLVCERIAAEIGLAPEIVRAMIFGG
jgi:hypothetical protein